MILLPKGKYRVRIAVSDDELTSALALRARFRWTGGLTATIMMPFARMYW
ncbi:MAG: hypothetical protein O3C11_01670 [Proteobacteria bacterium]|nr:hypothetical protein [Pseudomonadota bacterium]